MPTNVLPPKERGHFFFCFIQIMNSCLEGWRPLTSELPLHCKARESDRTRTAYGAKAMAAMLNQSQLCLCKQSARPSALAKSATSFSESSPSSSAPLPGARSRAASAWISIARNAVSLSADSPVARARYDGPSIVANVPRRSTPPLVGRSGRFTEVSFF